MLFLRIKFGIILYFWKRVAPSWVHGGWNFEIMARVRVIGRLLMEGWKFEGEKKGGKAAAFSVPRIGGPFVGS